MTFITIFHYILLVKIQGFYDISQLRILDTYVIGALSGFSFHFSLENFALDSIKVILGLGIALVLEGEI